MASATMMQGLEKLGWQFIPTGPDEWEWKKFDSKGNVVAVQNDEMWKKDVWKAIDHSEAPQG